jgi:serine/threonine protein kinase
MKKAFEWELSQLPCFYTSPDEENNLKPTNYLLRTSNTTGDALVIAYRDAATLEVERVLIRRLDKSLWQSGTDLPVGGTFADFIRRVLPKDSIPHNDASRVQQQQRQMSMRSASRTESVEQRAQSQLRGGSRPVGNNALLKAVVTPTSTVFNGVKSNVYGSVGAALQFAKENDENVFEGTVWTGLARTEALAALNPKHNDLNGVSLASEPWYFFDLDTFGANAILAGLAVGSYLVRLNSSMTQFVVSFMRETAMQPVHILLDIDKAQRTVTTINAPKFGTVRELVTKISALKIPLSRMDYAREFVDCAIELREKPLGLGSGGIVLRGVLNGQVDVAVKRLTATTEDSLADDAGRVSEAEAMLRIRPHPNVNRLYGLVLKPMSLVIEFCDRGSLDQILGIDGAPQPANGEFSNYSQAMVLKTNEMLQLARDIARGVAHLHDMRIVHRDLATRNILVTSPLVPKVCDFGMSRLLGEDEDVGQTAERKGPIKWQAPEQLRGVTRTYSFKSDVFSYAVLLTEIVNNQLPWPDFTNQAAAIEVVKGFRTKVSSQCPSSLRTLIQKCWNQDPDERPSMAEVAQLLENPATLHYDAAPTIPTTKSFYDDVGDV